MKWTKAQEDKLIKLIAEHKRDGYPDAEIYRLISKTMKRTPNALRHKHGSIKAELLVAESVDHMADQTAEPTSFPWDDVCANPIYKQRIGRALRNVDKKPLIIDMANTDYTRNFDVAREWKLPHCQKPKTFIEKIKEFFKGGNNE
jgi:hypothetical protein